MYFDDGSTISSVFSGIYFDVTELHLAVSGKFRFNKNDEKVSICENFFFFFFFFFFSEFFFLLISVLLHMYSRLSLSRPRLSRITAYVEVKIWSLF